MFQSHLLQLPTVLMGTSQEGKKPKPKQNRNTDN